MSRLFGRLFGREPQPRAPLDPAELWAASSRWEAMSSSNVAGARYTLGLQALDIAYHGGPVWRYSPVTHAQALAFYRAGSKGKFIWDHIKIRGRVHDHQVGAVRLS